MCASSLISSPEYKTGDPVKKDTYIQILTLKWFVMISTLYLCNNYIIADVSWWSINRKITAYTLRSVTATVFTNRNITAFLKIIIETDDAINNLPSRYSMWCNLHQKARLMYVMYNVIRLICVFWCHDAGSLGDGRSPWQHQMANLWQNRLTSLHLICNHLTGQM